MLSVLVDIMQVFIIFDLQWLDSARSRAGWLAIFYLFAKCARNRKIWRAITFLFGSLSVFGVVCSLRVAITLLWCVVYSLRVVVTSLCFVVSSLCLVIKSWRDVFLSWCGVMTSLRALVLSWCIEVVKLCIVRLSRCNVVTLLCDLVSSLCGLMWFRLYIFLTSLLIPSSSNQSLFAITNWLNWFLNGSQFLLFLGVKEKKPSRHKQRHLL